MRRSILSRFIAAYLLFAILGFCIINFTTTQLTYEHLVNSHAVTFNNSAKKLAQYLSNESLVDKDNWYNAASNIPAPAESLMWIIDLEGNLLYASSGTNNPTRISDFDLSYFNDAYYNIGSFYDNFSSQVLTVYHPIVSGDATIGYVLLHVSTTRVLSSTIKIVDIFYVSYLIILVFSIIVILAFILNIYMPLKALRRATYEYANGNFAYDKLSINSNNEFGELASSLNYMAHQLNDADAYQKKFVANISHDFRSPLTSIKGYVEAIIDGTIPYENQNKYLNIVLSEAERLERLTNGLIDLNTWGGQKHGLIVEEFNINDVITSILETFEGTSAKKGITIKYDNDQQHLVKADKDKIQQVLYNLIDNAIKFSHNGGDIVIKTYTKGDKIFCSIKDSGIGITKKELNKIWDRFFKTDASRGKDKTGSGIGLSIVKEIINAHNQTIDVISTEGIGTEFIFSLARVKNKKGIK